MAKLKYYRYGQRTGEKAKFPKKNFVRFEDSKDDCDKIAAYTALLPDDVVSKSNLVDLNCKMTKLAKLRLTAGIGQNEFAQMMGIPKRTIQTWESIGMNKASLDSVVMIADYFGVKDLREFYEPEEEN